MCSDSGVLCFHFWPHSTSAIIVPVSSCCVPSTWIAELQTRAGGRKPKPRTLETAVGLT